MASVFWNAGGIIFIGHLEKGKTIIGEYYANLLQRLNDKKEGINSKKKVLFHQDSAPAHKPFIVIVKFNELKLELLPHVLYSSDLTPRKIFCSQT